MPGDPNCTDCDVERIKGDIAAKQAEADHKNDVDLEKVKAGIAAEAADSAAVDASDAAAEAQDLAHRTLYHTKIAELAIGSIDRARDSAKFIQTASAALIAAYTGLLGLVFSTTSRTLPVRGVYAALFLGLAVALSVAYLAFLRGSSASVGAYEPGTSYADTQLARSINLIDWTNTVVSTRAWALRAAVLCLAIGVAFVPAAFIGPSSSAASGARCALATDDSVGGPFCDREFCEATLRSAGRRLSRRGQRVEVDDRTQAAHDLHGSVQHAARVRLDDRERRRGPVPPARDRRPHSRSHRRERRGAVRSQTTQCG